MTDDAQRTPTPEEQGEALRIYRAYVRMLKTAIVPDEWLVAEKRRCGWVLEWLVQGDRSVIDDVWEGR